MKIIIHKVYEIQFVLLHAQVEYVHASFKSVDILFLRHNGGRCNVYILEVFKVKVTLRLKISNSVFCGFEPTLGLVTIYCFLSEG
jgi:hypothetical protein